MNINTLFGDNVKRRRLLLGLSQENLANKAGIDRSYLPAVERGQRNVSLYVAQKIADALDINIKDLL